MKNNIDLIIKESFLKDSFKPFASSLFFEFFGYSRHFTFKRFLNSEEFYSEIVFNDYEKINVRVGNNIFFSKKLFLKLCDLNNIEKSVFENHYLEYKELTIKKETSFVVNLKKATFLFGYEYYAPAGKTFNYSLNSISLCNFIEIDHFDFIRFFCENAIYSIGFFRADFKSRSTFSKSCYPYYNFNSSNFNDRYSFLLLLRKIKEDFPLTDLQKKLLAVYYKHIKIMLEKQTSFEMNTKEKKESYLKFKEKQKQNFKDPKLKELYRKLSMMYHPDKNPEGEEIFKTINEAYKNNDMITMQKYIN